MNDDNYYTTEQVQQLYGLTSANICKTVSLRTRKIKDGRMLSYCLDYYPGYLNERYDFFDKEKMKGDFLANFKKLADKKNSKWQHVYMHFRTFTQGKVPLGR